MKTEYKDNQEVTVGKKVSSDASVASRGNVKETVKAFNKHIEDHYYDKSEVDYFFSKIWHWMKQHVVSSKFYTNMLGQVTGSHKEDKNYDIISKKPLSAESIDSLVEVLNNRISELEDKLSDVTGFKLPVGFTYVQFPNTPKPSELFDGVWKDVSAQYQGSFLRVDTDGKDLGNGVSPKFVETTDAYYGYVPAGCEDADEIIIQKESLPNVTGHFTTQEDANGGNVSGPFAVDKRGQVDKGFSESKNYITGITMNLANGNSIYSGTHVIPQNISVKVWVKTAMVDDPYYPTSPTLIFEEKFNPTGEIPESEKPPKFEGGIIGVIRDGDLIQSRG